MSVLGARGRPRVRGRSCTCGECDGLFRSGVEQGWRQQAYLGHPDVANDILIQRGDLDEPDMISMVWGVPRGTVV